MRLWINDEKTPEGKYPILLRRDGTVVEHPHFAILARDPAAPAALRAYADEGEKLNYDPAFIADVRALAVSFDEYRRDHGQGDPDAPRHRQDDPVIIAWARSLMQKRLAKLESLLK